MTERWRCFVAVPLGDGLRSELGEAMTTWRADPRTASLRWASPDSLHVTLAFLGRVDSAEIPAMAQAIHGVAARHAPAALPTGRLGAFARPGSARVLWYAVSDPDGRLAALAADAAAALGLAFDDLYRPHVTLARARGGSADLRDWIAEASRVAPDGRLEVESLHLMRSHLGGGPARYETLEAYPLGGAEA